VAIRRTGPRPAGYFNIVMTLLAFVHSLVTLPMLWGHAPYTLSLTWLQAAGLNISLDLKLTALNVGAMALISGINLLSQIFAIGYLEMDWGWARFFSLLGLFEGGMCALMICDSAFFSYIILEILTLGTYLLVGLWFSQPLVVTGARDAFLTKRVGDLVLLMGVVALLPVAGTWNFTELATWAETAQIDPTLATWLGLALIVGPMGKCAQIPLHLWLDEAMEGPLPSTILRNSVVVGVGAWVLVKLQPVINLSPTAVAVEVAIGAVTAVTAAAIAIAQIDIKRILSYTTSSFLGLVFVSTGMGYSDLALLLMFTYSVAMALLVMAVGCVIWNSISQDVTQYGGLWSKRPIAGPGFAIGALGLLALPPFGSFWVLWDLVDRLWGSQPVLVGIVLATCALTGLSLTRAFGHLFAGQTTQISERSPEVFWPMSLPTAILTGFVIHVPLLLANWGFLPTEAQWISAAALSLSSLAGVGLGAALFILPAHTQPVTWVPKIIQDFFAYDLYTPQFYRATIILFVGFISNLMYWFDRFIVDGVINMLGAVTVFSGQSLRYNTTGQTQFYALSILISIMLFGVVISWPLLSGLAKLAGSTP
jgi:NAD(P)H-quinone oxidoreductase subunit 5